VVTIKGQNLRILVGASAAQLRCLAAAQSCTAHVSMMLEDAATKSDGDEWTRNEPVGLAWDVDCDALIVTSDASAMISSMLVVGHTYTVRFSQTTGAQNRTQVTSRLQLTGTAILDSLELAAQVDDNATYRAHFTGSGELSQHA